MSTPHLIFTLFKRRDLGAAQNSNNPLLQAAEPVAQFYSQGPIDGCCSGRKGQHSLNPQTVWAGGGGVRHYSRKCRPKRRVTAAKISWVEPIKVCLTVVLGTKRTNYIHIHFPNLPNVTTLTGASQECYLHVQCVFSF